MRTIYLDMCCFNRPYDDQTQTRIRLETQAKLELQDHVKAGSCHLLWSAALDYKCSRNPYPDNQLAITHWRMHNAYLPTDALAILENWYEN